MVDFDDAVIEDVFGIIIQYGQQGGFIERFIIVWNTADVGNKKILKSAAEQIIKKYDLVKISDDLKSRIPEAKESSDKFWNSKTT